MVEWGLSPDLGAAGIPQQVGGISLNCSAKRHTTKWCQVVTLISPYGMCEVPCPLKVDSIRQLKGQEKRS